MCPDSLRKIEYGTREGSIESSSSKKRHPTSVIEEACLAAWAFFALRTVLAAASRKARLLPTPDPVPPPLLPPLIPLPVVAGEALAGDEDDGGGRGGNNATGAVGEGADAFRFFPQQASPPLVVPPLPPPPAAVEMLRGARSRPTQ